MNDWQMNLTKTLQKADPYGKITAIATTSGTNGGGEEDNNNPEMSKMMEKQHPTTTSSNKSSSSIASTNNEATVSIVKGATSLNSKAFAPNPIKIKTGNTITWINNDNTIHTVSSGKPNSQDAGQIFDSGLTSLISPSKSYSHKFTNPGEFSYFCRLHPNMVGTIEVEP